MSGPGDPHQEVVFRRPGGRFVVLALSGLWVFLIGGIVVQATSPSTGSTGGVVLLIIDAVLLALCIGGVFDTLLCSVRLTATAIERRRLLLHRTIAWSDVESASMETGRRQRKPVVLLARSDGRVDRLLEVQPARLRAQATVVDPENARLVQLINERVGRTRHVARSTP